jgi:hypothetical protein
MKLKSFLILYAIILLLIYSVIYFVGGKKESGDVAVKGVEPALNHDEGGELGAASEIVQKSDTGWKVYSNSSLGLSLQYPDDHEIAEGFTEDNNVYFRKIAVGDSADGQEKTILTVSAESITSEMSAKLVVRASWRLDGVRVFASELADGGNVNFKKDYSIIRTINDADGSAVEYYLLVNASTQNKERYYALSFFKEIAFDGNSAVETIEKTRLAEILSETRRDGDRELGDFDKMLSTFKIEGASSGQKKEDFYREFLDKEWGYKFNYPNSLVHDGEFRLVPVIFSGASITIGRQKGSSFKDCGIPMNETSSDKMVSISGIDFREQVGASFPKGYEENENKTIIERYYAISNGKCVIITLIYPESGAKGAISEKESLKTILSTLKFTD